MKNPSAKTLILLSTLSAFGLTLMPTDAEACSPPPSEGIEVEPLWEGVPIRRDGVLAARLTDYAGELSGADDEFTISVTREGVEVPGTVEIVEYADDDELSYARTGLIVWRPEVDFESDVYRVTIVVANDAWVGGEVTGETAVTVLDEFAGALDAEPIDVEMLDTVSAVGTGPRVCCDMDLGCGEGTSCQSTMERDAVMINGTFGLDPDDGRYAYVRVLTGIDGVADQHSGWVLPGNEVSEGWGVTFAESAQSYCLAYEYVSLIDGSTTNSNIACVDHGELVLDEREVDLEPWAANCLDEPYWEESGEPWIPNGESDGESDTDAPETDTGEESDTDGPGTSGTEGETVTESDSDSGGETDGGGGETDGGEGPGSDSDDAGCGCTTNDSGSGWLGLGLFGLLALLRRRQATRA